MDKVDDSAARLVSRGASGDASPGASRGGPGGASRGASGGSSRGASRGARRWGRLAERPTEVNPLDEFSGVRRAFEAFRLKEWVGFTLIHPDIFSAMIMQEAQYLASSELYVRELSSGALHEYAASAKGGSLALPRDLLHGGSCRFPASSNAGYQLGYDFDDEAGQYRIHLSMAASFQTPPLSGELTLDASGASAPLSVSARLGGHGWARPTLYTHKAVFPVSGELHVGQRRYVFDPDRDFAIIDEHRSRLPYLARWTWGTFAFHPDGGDDIVGANFAARPQPEGEAEESCLWLPAGEAPAQAERLMQVTFTAEGHDRLAPIHVCSGDGGLDVVFTPLGRKDVAHQFGLAAIGYHQLAGEYRGSIRSLDGREWTFGGVHGVLERMRMRS